MPSIGAAKQALLLTAAQIMHTAAYSSTIVAPAPTPVPRYRCDLRYRCDHGRSTKVVLHAAAAEASDDAVVDEAPAPTGLRAKLKKAASFKKGDLAKYGVSAFFAYGFVSTREQLPPPELHLGHF